MVTDLAEVYRLGTAKAKENLAFRRYVSAHHIPEKQFQILASDIQRHIDCTACANCCRHSVVTVTKVDIAGIAAHLSMKTEDVRHLYTVEDPEAPGLRTLVSSDAGCVFLDGSLCMVYEARPAACREFPHVSIGSHSLGARPSSHDRWAALCPIIYNAIEEYKHLTGFHPTASDRHPPSTPVR